MNLKLTVYTDDTLTEVKKVYEADKLKIPYRVVMKAMETLDSVNLNNTDDVLGVVTKNVGSIDKIIKATFGVTDNDLEHVDVTEMIDTGKEVYKWVIEKVQSLKKEGKQGNLQAAAGTMMAAI